MSWLVLLALLADPPYVIWAAQPNTPFIDIENIGDINLDGTDDVIAAPGSGAGLYCLSGLTGDSIWYNSQVPAICMSGAIQAIPDINGDGSNDIAVGGEDGTISAFSGLDGSLIWSKQSDWPVHAVNYSTGSTSYSPIIHSTLWGMNGYTYFLALDGLAGDSLWRYQTWTEDRQISVISDFSGNNWDEISICHDRGSAYSGFCEVVDGLTGQSLYSTSTIYFSAMDITDTPLFILASYSWGDDIAIRAEDMISGDTLYTIAEGLFGGDRLMFVKGVTGGSISFPILMAWVSGSSDLNLASGLTGVVETPISYASPIVLPVAYQQSGSVWRLAVLTNEYFYLTEPSGGSTPPGPTCSLPAPLGSDISLLSSGEYPTKIAAVAMAGVSGPGLCAIATSWPTEIDHHQSHPLEPGMQLLSNPGLGGISMCNERTSETIRILDLTGRCVQEVYLQHAQVQFISLPAGVYHILNSENSFCAPRAIVLSN